MNNERVHKRKKVQSTVYESANLQVLGRAACAHINMLGLERVTVFFLFFGCSKNIFN